MSSNEMVKANSMPASTAGMSSGRVISKKVWTARRRGARRLLVCRADADQPRLHHQDHEGQREDHMAHQQQEEAARLIEPAQEQEQRHRQHRLGHQDRARSAAVKISSCPGTE
jgi:hypothetical protein